MRKYGKTDANQAACVAYLRSIGAQVQSLASIGGGVPDLLVAFRGQWYVIEIKDGTKPPSKQKLTPEEELWHEQFSACASVHTARTVEDLSAILGVNC